VLSCETTFPHVDAEREIMADSRGFDKRHADLIDRYVKDVKKGPVVGLSEVNAFSVRRGHLERWDLAAKKISTPNTDDEILERIGVVYLFGSRQVVLASGLCYDQTKWDGGLKCRTSCTEIVAEFSHPSLDQIWTDVQDCANIAAAAAGIAALLSGGAAAVAAFKASFYGCISAKCGDWAAVVQISVFGREKTGNWRWCM